MNVGNKRLSRLLVAVLLLSVPVVAATAQSGRGARRGGRGARGATPDQRVAAYDTSTVQNGNVRDSAWHERKIGLKEGFDYRIRIDCTSCTRNGRRAAAPGDAVQIRERPSDPDERPVSESWDSGRELRIANAKRVTFSYQVRMSGCTEGQTCTYSITVLARKAPKEPPTPVRPGRSAETVHGHPTLRAPAAPDRTR